MIQMTIDEEIRKYRPGRRRTWVQWTPEESAKLARWGAQSYFARGHMPTLEESQIAVLATDRHRLSNKNSINAFRNLVRDEIEQAQAENRLARIAHEVREEVHAPREPEPLQAAPAPQEVSAPVEEIPAPRSPVADVQRAVVEWGAELLVGMLTHPDVLAALAGLIPAAKGQPAPKHNPWAALPDARKGKPRVLVVGLRGTQMSEIEKSHGDVFDLRYHGADESFGTARKLAQNADHAVAAVGFISHSLEQSVRTGIAGRGFHRVSGGITSVRAVLDNILNEATT